MFSGAQLSMLRLLMASLHASLLHRTISITTWEANVNLFLFRFPEHHALFSSSFNLSPWIFLLVLIYPQLRFPIANLSLWALYFLFPSTRSVLSFSHFILFWCIYAFSSPCLGTRKNSTSSVDMYLIRIINHEDSVLTIHWINLMPIHSTDLSIQLYLYIALWFWNCTSAMTCILSY